MKKNSHLTLESRHKIKQLMDDQCPIKLIADNLGVSRGTIYNEINLNSLPDGTYDPEYAEMQSSLRRNHTKPITEKHPKLADFIAEKILVDHLSIEQISAIICADKDNFPDQTICQGSIYNSIKKGLIPGITMETLKSYKTKMFSGGLLRLPNHILDQTGFKDGDEFEIDVSVENQITFRKIEKEK